jgi:hypothetical protein
MVPQYRELEHNPAEAEASNPIEARGQYPAPSELPIAGG